MLKKLLPSLPKLNTLKPANRVTTMRRFGTSKSALPFYPVHTHKLHRPYLTTPICYSISNANT